MSEAHATPDEPSTDAELRQVVGSLRSEVERLRAENQLLRAQLEEATRASKRQAAPFRKGPPKPEPKTPGRKSGDAHGTHGHRPPPDPDRVDQVLVAPLPDACPACGGTVTGTDIAHQFQTDIPRVPVVRRFDIHVGCCDGCGCRVQGRHPLQTSDALGAAASQVGPDAQAAVVTLNKEAGLSHGKIAELFGSLFGIPLTRGASAQIVLRAADRLAPAYEEIRREVRDADRLTVDETGWRVGGRSAWLHVRVGERATCYAIDPSRSADALQGVIGLDWDGILVRDGFASYDRFREALHQGCLAHIARRCQELLAGAKAGAVRFPRQMLGLFTGALHLRNEHAKGHVPDEVWEGARDDFETWLLRLLSVRRVVPEYQRLSDHLWRHFASWWTFLTDPSVPATNWEAEQAIRPAVVNRKVWGGNRTEAGAKAQGV
ncbi:MAG: IS66 family transposase, partial [Gemmataceae bacterium]